MTWHRIDDPDNPAPKDGTVVLTWSAGEGFNTVAWWLGNNCWAQESDSGRLTTFHPTHWQPLPNPPEKERT